MIYQAELREYQRRFAQQYSDVVVMSLTGIDNFDGCHFTFPGYMQMAENVFRLVARDFYASGDIHEIVPADIVDAYYTTALSDEIAIRVQNAGTLVYPIPIYGHAILDAVYLDGAPARPIAFTIQGDRVTLKMQSSVRVSAVTYLPGRNYDRQPTSTFQGPFIRNARGIGMFSFKDFPIRKDIVTRDSVKFARQGYTMFENYPSPSHGRITFSWNSPGLTNARIRIYDGLGGLVERLFDGPIAPGIQAVTWTPKSSSGMYYARFEGNGINVTRKVFLVK